MKVSPVLTLSFLPLLTIANPISHTNVAPLEPRADTCCTLGATVDYDVHCRAGAGSGYDHVR